MTDDMHQNKMDFLEVVHTLDETAAGCISGIEKIVSGGPQGMRELAQVDPASIIVGFAGLAMLVEQQRNLIKLLVEENASIIDGLEKLAEKTKDENDSQ